MVVVTLAVAGCGGSSKPRSTSSKATTAALPSANPASASSASVTSGPVRATLSAANHTPLANKLWSYTVRATSAGGSPLSGTVETDFVLSGLGVVGKETPPVHALKNGVLHDSITFPASALGHPLNLVTVVHTNAGSVALAWPVSVKRS
jgi:hypothetical protein